MRIVFFFFSCFSASLLYAQTPAPIRSDDLLKVDLLFVGAHPDDESGVTATFAREVIDRGARAAIVLATRGEGGGNAIGRELGLSLGLLREAELRRAAAVYGVDLIYFLDKTDFFYTLSSQASFAVWNHDDALERLVRLIRLLRPDVIVTMWPGPGTHGMHQAAARLATEAFARAADSSSFPHQIDAEYLRSWQPLKLYYNTDRPGAAPMPSGDISPERFMSYAEMKALALRNYRSQGFDRFASLPPARAGAESFLLVKSFVSPEAETGNLLDGVERPLARPVALGPDRQKPALDLTILPRSDVDEFRLWAEKEEVAWAAGLLPSSLSIGVGQTDTVRVSVKNNGTERRRGTLSLALPDAWNPASDQLYDIPAGKETRLKFGVRVPETVSQGSYAFRARTVFSGATVSDSGFIEALPVMSLSRSPGAIQVDGRLDDWAGASPQAIPSTRIWSGSLPGGDQDCSGSFMISYDRAFLFIAVQVTDDRVVTNIAPDDIKGHWRSDAVEICIDPSGGSENTLSVFKMGVFPGTTDGRQARAARDADARQGVIEKTAPGTRVASGFTGSGYIIEAAIPWMDMPGGAAPVPAHELGLNVIIYDGDDVGAGVGANIGKARLAWSCWPSAQALPCYYGRVRVE